MESNVSIRWGWLKAMYIYTLFGAGGFGLALLVFPAAVQSMLRFPPRTRSASDFMGAFYLRPG